MIKTVKFLTPAIALMLMAVACDNSSSQISKEKMQEINTQSQFADTVKAVSSIKIDFENYATDKLLEGWSQYFSGSGGTDWKVTNDKGNKALAQLYSENPNGHFNIVVNDSLQAKNMILSVRLKGVSGKHDQGGGFVWRFINKDNYYLVRANPLEDNVVLYKVENGKRSDLPLIGKGKTYGVDVPKLGNDWNTLKLVVKEDIFTVFLNGKELFKVQDTIFPDAGKTGFWTKADAVTYFDDFEIHQY